MYNSQKNYNLTPYNTYIELLAILEISRIVTNTMAQTFVVFLSFCIYYIGFDILSCSQTLTILSLLGPRANHQSCALL